MARVGKLHIWPQLLSDADPDPDYTMNAYCDRFLAENTPLLAASPVIDSLVELRPCGCHSTGALTVQSAKNLTLCKELIEPRVYGEHRF